MKEKSIEEPRWIGLATLACGVILFMIFQVFLSLYLDHKWVIPSVLGTKGEGLFFLLLVYIPLRRFLLFIYDKRKRRESNSDLSEDR